MNKNSRALPLLKRALRSIWTKYTAISLLVLAPLLLPGFILTLDMVFVPDPQFPASVSNTYPIELLLWLLGLILPGDILQKIILLTILIFSGAGMHLLVRQVRPLSLPARFWLIPCHAAGIFYMINPFVYSRFMAGQWLFLLGYALLPFFVRSLIILIAQPTLIRGATAGLLAALITCLSIHHIGILIIAAAACGCITIFRRRPAILKSLVSASAAGLGTFILLSSFWLVPVMTGPSELSSASDFDRSHYEAFKTDGGAASVIRLQGFWAESQNLFALPQAVMPGWGILFAGFWIVAIIGAVYAWRTSRTAFALSVGFIIIGIILSALPVIQAASTILPLLSGYREPHKFASLIVLGYAILFAFGTARIIVKARRPAYWSAGLLCLPLLLAPTMLWGFAGQLTPRQYPGQWHEADRHLALHAKKDTLFLPWHQYAPFSFSGRIVATPAEKFFSSPVIASNDPEFGNISPTVSDQRRHKISRLLRDKPLDIAAKLQHLGISNILLATEQDSADYAWIDVRPGIKKIQQNDRLILYVLEDTR